MKARTFAGRSTLVALLATALCVAWSCGSDESFPPAVDGWFVGGGGAGGAGRHCPGVETSALEPGAAIDVGGVSTRGLGTRPTTCASNPCDPYCRTYDDTPKDSLDGGCGLTYDDAGAIVLGGTPCTESGGSSDAGASDSGSPSSSACGPYQIQCGGVCVTPKVDPNHCGSCGNVCGASQVCSAGVCTSTCQDKLTKCGRACVDTRTDNNNCGACGTVCGSGKGCNTGTCVPTISVGAAPAQCLNGGPPIQVASVSGPIDCAGNLAQKTFQRAFCSCNGVEMGARSLTTDGFDSRLGPYTAGGLGADFGANGTVSLDLSGSLDIGGEAVFGDAVSGKAGKITVAEGMKASSSLSFSLTGAGTVTGDAYVVGNWTSGTAHGKVTGNYFTPLGTTVAPTVVGTIVRGPVSLPTPCPCGASDMVPAASIVGLHVTNNDNALIGLDPNALADGGRLDLPCGHYYLAQIGSSWTSHDTTIVTHGNTALYIASQLGGLATGFSISPDPSSNLDVFVSGDIDLTLGSGGVLGNANYPAQMRIYMGGTALKFKAAKGFLFANVDARGAEISLFGGGYVNYGSTYAKSISGVGGGVVVHHDRAVHDASSTCAVNLKPATFSRLFKAECGPGERANWDAFTYDTYDPTGTNVTFAAKSAKTTAALATASPVSLAVAGYSPAGSTTTADPQVCTGACKVALSTKIVPNNLDYLRLDATLNPSSSQSPALRAWNVTYRCVPSE